MPKVIQQDNFIFYKCPLNAKFSFFRHFWEQLILPLEIKLKNINVLFTAKNANILLAPCKTVISIRNMEPLCYKNYKNHWKLNFFSWHRNKLTTLAIKKADKIIAVSKFVKEYLEQHYSGLSNKIDVIYNGNPVHKNDSVNIIEKRGPFLLSASKFVAYANQFNLIQGYFEAYKRNLNIPPLWFVGGVLDKLYFKKVEKFIKNNDLTEKVKILGLVSHEHLIKLYKSSFAFLFPSTLEACPQTLIEAMACGIPIATSNIPPMTEICDKAAIYFDPFNKNDMAEKIELLLTDYRLRDSLRKLALERSKFFDWGQIAIKMIKVFQETCIA